MRHDGGNTLQYQAHREGLRTLPLKAMECGILRSQQVRDLTGVKTRIGRRVSASGACRGSNHPVAPNVFCLRMVLSPNTSDHDGICCLRPMTAKR
jgi:hypothetical protein